MESMKSTGIAIAACMVGGLLVALAAGSYRPGQSSAPTETVDQVPPVESFTKEQFIAAVDGKTKDQIRVQFGSPDNVDDGADAWYYWHLPVYDSTAGTKVNNSKITFDGVRGSGDRVADVSFP